MISLLTSERQVPKFHIKAYIKVMPSLCRLPSGQEKGDFQTHPSAPLRERSGFDNNDKRFRHLIKGSFAFISLIHT